MTESPATTLRTSRLLNAIALLLMLVGMGAMRARLEHFSGAALVLVIAAAIVLGITTLSRLSLESHRFSKLTCMLLAIALAVEFSQLPMLGLLFHWGFSAAPLYFISIGVMLVLTVLISIASRPGIRTMLFLLLLAAHAVVGWWFLSNKPGENCDVYIIQKLGVEALLHGQNPFAITFPDIYGPNAHFYPPGIVLQHVVQMPGGPGIARDVQCGYFYLPMSLLLAVPGYLCGDVRYSNLLALEIAAALIAYARPSRISFLCAVVVLLCPGIFVILSNAWIEPEMLMLLAAAVFPAIRGYRTWCWVALGLLVAQKQYMILAIPVFVLMVPSSGVKSLMRPLLIVALTAAVIILPFFLWDPRTFLHSETALYVNLLRTDSISIPAWLMLRFNLRSHLPVTGGVGCVIAIATALRGRRDPASFAVGMAFVLTVSFLCSTQAFINYYFLVSGCIAAAIAIASIANLESRSDAAG